MLVYCIVAGMQRLYCILYICPMRVFRNLDNLALFTNSVVTIGTFDGVHLGHRKIISGIKELAESCAGETVLLAPACSSFDQFSSYEHRGRVFKDLVNALEEADR